MTNINPYEEMEYQPEQIRDFLIENSFNGYRQELLEDINIHFQSYTQLYDQAVTIPDCENNAAPIIDAELFDKAKAELEIANKLMEKLVIDLQERDGVYGVEKCNFKAEGEK